MGNILDIHGKPTPTDGEKTFKEIMARRQSILEMFTQAYIAETGLKPSEIQLVERRTMDAFEWNFEPTHKDLKSIYEMNLEDQVETLKECLNSFNKGHCWCDFVAGRDDRHTNQCRAVQKAMGMKA